MPICLPPRSPRSPARRRRPLYLLTALVGLVPGYTVSAHTTGGTFLLWQFDPAVWLGLILVGAAYIYATGVLEQRDPPSITTAQTWCFLGGLIVAFLALQSPIDTFSDNSFWVHMIQHILLISVVPPLLLLGTPGGLLRPALRIPGVRPVMRAADTPRCSVAARHRHLSCLAHPHLYDAAVLDLRIHAVEHLCFHRHGAVVLVARLQPRAGRTAPPDAREPGAVPRGLMSAECSARGGARFWPDCVLRRVRGGEPVGEHLAARRSANWWLDHVGTRQSALPGDYFQAVL